MTSCVHGVEVLNRGSSRMSSMTGVVESGGGYSLVVCFDWPPVMSGAGRHRKLQIAKCEHQGAPAVSELG